MKGLAELVVSLCDLCEAEGRLLEAGILRTVRRAGLLALGLLFGAGALALLLGALYAFLTALLPTPAALALLGCASAGVAGLLLWGAAKRVPPAATPVADREAEPQKGKGAHTASETPRVEAVKAPPAQKSGDSENLWADVPPYGHKAHAGGGSGPGAIASLKRDAVKADDLPADGPAGGKNG